MNVTSNLPPFSFVAAVFLFGGYPQKPWDEAVRELELKVRYVANSDTISPTSLFVLGRKMFGPNYKFL